ncbi:hypothetical protein F443_18254 [Phytophthora nicotianae P1569]|uniref:ZSWIM1/3 RNaseH-like domain-containing protein n=1 Tax=Phytophthora nicotianae P1569 TaxID=1317065 RepID=V9E8J1_PHYNI|nr:hypothetical protein F443_18254 [Phytophthora nicotianae P1569]
MFVVCVVLGKNVTLREVHNLVQRLKARRLGIATVEDRLQAVLRKFCAFRDNTASIVVTETETTQTTTLQTRQTHRFFKAFPEVLMLDSTHGTNVSKYKLFIFMIEDGQYVQHALVENESHTCMKEAIGAFKENNPTWDAIRAIMTDKNFRESSLLKRTFPLALPLEEVFTYGDGQIRVLWPQPRYFYRVEDAVDLMVK